MEIMQGRVLIVEDDSYLLETLTQALADEGYFVVGAKDGTEAITDLNLVDYDLILLDLEMPRIDGAEVARLFKDLAPSVPIVIMSGHSMGRRFAKILGLAGCLEKPFELEELLALVKTHCSPAPYSFDHSLWQSY